MPKITSGSDYLVAFLHSAGTASPTGMGLTGLSWAEIDAWVKCTDMQGIVTPRDLRTIHTLSRAYAGESSKATDKLAKPPYEVKLEMVEEIREIVEQKVEDLFSAMIAAQMVNKPK